MICIEVIIPLPLEGVYSYIVPAEFAKQIRRGVRVVVPFGKKKFYTAIVYRISESLPATEYELKPILTVLDEIPIVGDKQFLFWEWLSSYYLCSPGEVCKAALPSVFKLESETQVRLTGAELANIGLSEPEKKVLDALLVHKNLLNLQDIEKYTGLRSTPNLVKTLVDKGCVSVCESMQKDYGAKLEPVVEWAEKFSEPDRCRWLDRLQKSPSQKRLLENFMELTLESCSFVPKKALLAYSGQSSAILTELVRKGILKVDYRPIDRISFQKEGGSYEKCLNVSQENAYSELKELFVAKNTVLLFGVTGSGKTEIYIRLIKECIGKGKQVLFLLPEIALTTQITERLRIVFGEQMLVYHSRYNDNERGEVWQKVRDGVECKLVIGARSAVFLPFADLGLVIVDEEHEASYKQTEPNPKYQGRDSAIVLAKLYGAKVLLGSATPSVESYYNAQKGKYGLVTLDRRFGDIALPEIQVVNTKELRRKKQMKTSLSPFLRETIEKALENKEQIILFQNRRGYAPLLECKVCGYTPTCSHCDVSLTYHKWDGTLSCHYCGAVYSVPACCPECKEATMDVQGYGTERIEEEVVAAFPQANTGRMDLDTTRAKRSFERIITDFENGRTDILIGTQMLSKGLDFEHVSAVGILNADGLMNYPAFRAHERAYQLMVQVSGRAGRKHKQGLVVLQTAHPGHPVIRSVVENDYKKFYLSQLEERRLFGYPPFSRLIEISLASKDEVVLIHAATYFFEKLHTMFAHRVIGPGKPVVGKIKNLYYRRILLKIELNADLDKVKFLVKNCEMQMLGNRDFSGVMIRYDVDPA